MKVKSRSHLEKMTWPVLLIRSSQKFEVMTIFMFSRARNPFLTLLLSFHFRVTSEIQVKFRYRRYSKVLMIVSYIFSKFLDYIRFLRVKEFIANIPTELLCLVDLENLGQLPVQEVLEGTDDCVLYIFEISWLYTFLRSKNSLPTFLLSYYVWLTSKI